jgi:hypothetical protein
MLRSLLRTVVFATLGERPHIMVNRPRVIS